MKLERDSLRIVDTAPRPRSVCATFVKSDPEDKYSYSDGVVIGNAYGLDSNYRVYDMIEKFGITREEQDFITEEGLKIMEEYAVNKCKESLRG